MKRFTCKCCINGAKTLGDEIECRLHPTVIRKSSNLWCAEGKWVVLYESAEFLTVVSREKAIEDTLAGEKFKKVGSI